MTGVIGHDLIPGYEAPVHRSLTEPILLAGAPRAVAILNGTLSAAIGLGLRLWIAGLVLTGAFPPFGFWPLAIVGPAMLFLAVWGKRPFMTFVLALTNPDAREPAEPFKTIGPGQSLPPSGQNRQAADMLFTLVVAIHALEAAR